MLPDFDEKSGIIGFTSVAIDITAKKEGEDKIFHQAKLVSLGEMASGIGHEINNPLTISMGNILAIKKDLLEMGFSHTSILEKLDKVNEANERINKIVLALRTYSRQDTVKEEVISMNDIVFSTVNLVRDIYEKDQISISIENNDPDSFVVGFKGKLQQILMNLLSNAKDAIAENKNKKIIIKISQVDQNVKLSVIDNGCGIPHKIKQKILNPFFTTKSVGKGTGIGLSFVHEQVNKMNGELIIESKEGIGSTFTISFPLSDQVCSISRNTKVEEEVHLSGSVLVVDDEEGIREILTDIFTDLGLKVDEAEDGDIALEMVKSKKYDFICTDMKMKRMQGDQFIVEAKKVVGDECAIFIITGGVTDNYMDNADNVLSDLINGQIDKPFTPKSIAKIFSNFKKAS